MMKQTALMTLALAALLALGCGGSDEEDVDAAATEATGAGGTAEGDAIDDAEEGATGTDTAEPAAEPTPEPEVVKVGEGCQFDETQQGKVVGKHVKNFGVKDSDENPFWLHSYCGDDHEVVWIILSTGW